FPPLSREEVMNCTFSLWYPKLQEVTFKSEIIRPLDEKFLAYLLSDGVFLPDDEANPVFSGKFEEHGLSDDENAVKWSDTDNEDDNDVDIDIENTSTEIRKAIERLGGRVFPRMNWTSPRDAVHMTTSDSLKCTNPSQIYLLLKSSYNIASDIENGRYLPREQLGEFKPELVLRQWYNLIPSMEFRCFVKHRKIIAISQIDPHYYDFLEDMRSEILSKIGELFESHVCPSFPSTNYCFDAYIARTIDKTYVVDFEPWTHTVESILFDWEELLEA
ncbi:D123-domain-containing protein, partial [Coemansia spiralis]